MNHSPSRTAGPKVKFNRFLVSNPDVIESFPGVLPARKLNHQPVGRPSETPPAGYKMVDSENHEISSRDMVFLGGLRSYWMPARRAGEIGSLCRHSMAMGVAALLN